MPPPANPLQVAGGRLSADWATVGGVADPNRLPDEGGDLLADLRAGDEAAFTAIVDAWSSAMLHFAGRFVVDQHTAQDVVQETWLIVIKNLDRFEQRSSLRTWVFGILVNTAKARSARDLRLDVLPNAGEPTVDPRRFHGRNELHAGGWTDAGAPVRWNPSPESAAIAGETRKLIAAAIAALPEPGRTVISLRDVDGLPAEEVCGLLDISAANQRVLLHRARSKVRQALEHYYRGDDER